MDLTADRVNLNRLFGPRGEQLQIPPYQRPYAWEAEQIDDLWEDLTATLETGHFLGTIVLNTEAEDRPQVIDGQQRLTTLLILLGLVRDEYHRLEHEWAGRVQSLMFADRYARGDDVYRLRTGDRNWLPFRDLVLRSPGDDERLTLAEVGSLPKEVQAWNKPLFENIRRLKSKLENWLPEDVARGERVARLERLEQAIVSKLQLVAIRVGSVADAFLLFETLNDRGLQLSAADLLKNHLLAQVAQQGEGERAVRQAAAEWDMLIDDLGPGVDVTRFLRHYLLIQAPGVRKEEVYDRFKDQVSEVGPSSLMQELRSYGKLYGEFEDPNRVAEPRVADVLRDLQTLRATSCYSALMPARRFLSSDVFVAFARLAEVLTFRYSTIVSRDSKELEKIYHRAAKNLAESRGDGIESARRELIQAMPDSPIFVQSFMGQRMGTQYLVRYTLGRIEEHVSEEREKQLRPNRKVHIEHIMPQTLSDAWRDAIDDPLDEHAEHVNLWGNLTLLYHKLNSAASNKPFSEKKLHYDNSGVELTRRLCDYENWSFVEIIERQKWLAELADRIWSVDALEGKRRELPDWNERKRRLQSLLSREEYEKSLELAVETSAEEALALAEPVTGHLRSIEESGSIDEVTLDLARRLSASLLELIEHSSSFDAHGRNLLRGAVDYFVLEEDVTPDLEGPEGLADDLRVLNAVCEVLGRPEAKADPVG